MNNNTDHLHEPVLRFARKDFPIIRENLNVGEALSIIRREGIGEQIIYFYVINDDGQLVGIIPTRRLLTSMPTVSITDIMITDVVTVSHRATVLEACEMFVKHKFFAFPVVDDDNHIRGVIDVGFFTEETIDLAERQQVEDVFQLIGFGIEQLKGRSAFGVFRYRFPWLVATMASGTICALLAGAYETTLAQTLILAFFLTLVLGLGESVSIQSMTVALQNLHFGRPSWQTYLGWLRSEATSTLLLGIVCGTIIGAVAWLWRGELLPAVSIGSTIVLAITTAGILGLSIPALLHSIKEDSKIAAGPLTLAFADIATLLFYFNLAVLIL
ncbi:MAG TPA: CBS domain-containing protein [Pyrinomonadaceae bacterium]|nr:CBS domain-containing protein [Pyrinomonadaceae bacterium]